MANLQKIEALAEKRTDVLSKVWGLLRFESVIAPLLATNANNSTSMQNIYEKYKLLCHSIEFVLLLYLFAYFCYLLGPRPLMGT